MNQSSLQQKTAPVLKSHFIYATLGLNVVEDVHAIMTAVNHALPEGKKHFLKPQTVADLQSHIENGFPVLGAINCHTGELGAILLITPTEDKTLCKNLDGYQLIDQAKTAVIQCVAVHPKFEGIGLMKAMLKTAELVAANMGIRNLVAKIATEGATFEGNKASEAGFARAGFEASAKGNDPKLNYPVQYWTKSALPQVANVDHPVFNGEYGHNNSPKFDFSKPTERTGSSTSFAEDPRPLSFF